MAVYINLDQACTLTSYERSKPWGVSYYTWTINGGWFSRLIGRTAITKNAFVKDKWDGFLVLEGDALAKYLKEEHCYVDESNNTIYYHPHVDAHMSNQKTVTKYFTTVEDMKSWVTDAQKLNPNLVIVNK